MKDEQIEVVATALDGIANQIEFSLRSENVSDSNGEIANVVDVLAELGRATRRLGNAITPNIVGGQDAFGGHVESLTEAVMGVTNGLMDIAEAIREVAARMPSGD